MDQEISKGTWVGATILAIVAILVVLTFIGGEFLAVVPMTITQWALVTFMAITVIPVGCVLKTFVLKNLK